MPTLSIWKIPPEVQPAVALPNEAKANDVLPVLCRE